MRRRLCAAILALESVVLGLTTPVMIAVEKVPVATGLWVGLGLCGLCLVTAGLLRWSWVYAVGWAIQAAAVLLGVVVGVMIVLGLIFLALYAAAYLIGRRIDLDRAAWLARDTASAPGDSGDRLES